MTISDWADLRKRAGAFRLSLALFESNLEIVARVMQHVIITRCEFCFMSHSFHYQALSHFFREVDEGEVLPHYIFYADEYNDLHCRERDNAGQ